VSGAPDTRAMILKVLMDHPLARDSDSYLLWHLIVAYGWPPNDLKVVALLTSIKKGGFPDLETILHYRRMIQTERVDLRGKIWESRCQNEAGYLREIGYVWREDPAQPKQSEEPDPRLEHRVVQSIIKNFDVEIIK
jgi:hypothetical protein